MLSMLRCSVSPIVAPLYASTSRWTSRPLTWTGLFSALDVTSSPWTTRNFSSAPWTALRPSTRVRKL